MNRDEFLAKYRHELAGRIVYASILKITNENIIDWTQKCVMSVEALLSQMYADLIPVSPKEKK